MRGAANRELFRAVPEGPGRKRGKGDETYYVANEYDEEEDNLVKINLPENVRIVGVYWNGTEQKGKEQIIQQGDEYYLKVPRGGGVTLAVELVELCQVSFNANGGTGTMASVTVDKDSEYTLPACKFTAPEGKEFSGWDKGAVGDKIKVDADTVVKAQWKKQTCTVSFNANGGSGSMDAVKVKKGTEYTLPDCDFTAPEGKEFSGWDKGAVGAKIKIDADTVVKAQWSEKPVPPTPQPYNTYVLTIDPNGGEVNGHTETFKVSIVEDVNYRLPAPADREGYELVGWYVGKIGRNDPSWVDPKEDDEHIRKAGELFKVDQTWVLTAIWK